jgi:hypothetical protein
MTQHKEKEYSNWFFRTWASKLEYKGYSADTIRDYRLLLPRSTWNDPRNATCLAIYRRRSRSPLKRIATRSRSRAPHRQISRRSTVISRAGPSGDDPGEPPLAKARFIGVFAVGAEHLQNTYKKRKSITWNYKPGIVLYANRGGAS